MAFGNVDKMGFGVGYISVLFVMFCEEDQFFRKRDASAFQDEARRLRPVELQLQ